MSDLGVQGSASRRSGDRHPSRALGGPTAAAGLVRLAVVGSVLLAAVLSLGGLAYSAWRFDARADRNAGWSELDRTYGYRAATPRVRSHRGVVETARASMPDGAGYRVVVGAGWRPLWDVDWHGARGRDLEADFLRYFLLPRRETRSPSAPWLFCFGCDRSQLDGRFRVLSESRDGFSFGRLER